MASYEEMIVQEVVASVFSMAISEVGISIGTNIIIIASGAYELPDGKDPRWEKVKAAIPARVQKFLIRVFG
jgi:hypothetical protein